MSAGRQEYLLPMKISSALVLYLRFSTLQDFPPEGSNGVKSSIKQSDIEHYLDGLTVEEVEPYLDLNAAMSTDRLC